MKGRSSRVEGKWWEKRQNNCSVLVNPRKLSFILHFATVYPLKYLITPNFFFFFCCYFYRGCADWSGGPLFWIPSSKYYYLLILTADLWQKISCYHSSVSLSLRLRRKHFTWNILIANFRIFLYTWHYLMHSGPLKKNPRVVFNIFHTAYASKKMESLCLQLLRLEHIYTTGECSYRGATARRLNAHRHVMSQRLI